MNKIYLLSLYKYFADLLDDVAIVVTMAGTELSADILAAVAARIEENNKRRFIDLQELIKSIKFSKQEINMMYRGFKQVKIGFMILRMKGNLDD